MLLLLTFVNIFVYVTANRFDATPRIINGTAAKIENFPYLVVILYKNGVICGGSILTEKLILTASHCTVNRQPIHMLVRAGVTNYKSEEGQTVNVSAIYNHPDFLLKTYENDISILKLKEPLVLGDKVALVEITKTEPKAKEIAFAAGWGSTSTSKFSDELLYVKLPIVDRNECKTLLKPSLFTDDMICAGYMEGIYDTCKGDSGGPLVIDNKLVGITSWGTGCALPRKPGVYTNIVYFDDWLTKMKQQLS